MNIFISWSGPLSRSVATEFKDWIEDVLQLADPWMSDEDIPSGSIWFEEIDNELENAGYGILFVTKRNQRSPWLLWEAGALFGGFKDGRRREVVPVLIDLPKSDLISPLDKFQAVRATNKKDMLKMLGWINRDLPKSISRTKLENQLNRCWDAWHDAVETATKKVQDKSSGEEYSEHTFSEAAEKFIRSGIPERDFYALTWPTHFIGDRRLDEINDEALKPYLEQRREGTIEVPEGKTQPKPAMPATIQKEVHVLTRVLKYAKKLGWITHVPQISRVARPTKRKHYFLTWDEQERLMKELPESIKPVVLFAANTGAPRGLMNDMEWTWVTDISSMGVSMIVVPEDYDNSKYRRTILLNSVASAVIDGQRGKHDRFVFPGQEGGRLSMYKPFSKAWKRSGLSTKDGHALGISVMRWTFEHRLEIADVPRDIREFLMWKGEGVKEYADKPPDYAKLLNYLERIAERPSEEG